MGKPLIPSVDSDTKQFPDVVRERIAENLADPTSPEGAVIASLASGGATQVVLQPDVTSAQEAIDAVAAAGGGTVYLSPAIAYRWDNTLLMATNVELDGQWATVRGTWTGGGALIHHKGFDQPGYAGANNWSVRRLIIDSPGTNGIVTCHSSGFHVSDILGLSVYDHYLDIAASTDYLASQLRFFGTMYGAALQFDSARSGGGFDNQALRIDGRSVSSLKDDTPVNGGRISDFVIRAAAGSTFTHNADGSQVQGGIHFHRGDGSNVTFTNGSVGGFSKPVMRDSGTSWDKVRFFNTTLEGGANDIGGSTPGPVFFNCLLNGAALNTGGGGGSTESLNLSPSGLLTLVGTATTGQVQSGDGTSRRAALLYAPAVDTRTGTQITIPDSWNSVNVDVWWTNPTTEAGTAVRMSTMVASVGNGQVLPTAISEAADTITVPAQYVLKRSRLSSGVAVSPGQMLTLQVRRYATASQDTFAGNLALLAVTLTKAA